MRARRGAYRFLVGKPAGRRLLGRLRHMWENSIKIDLEKWKREWTEWIRLRIGIDGGLL
jgi:hypothetical protein